jgi:hypothetical protein
MIELFVTSEKKHVKHVEGDVWEERGKLWTIKNGIKRTVTKMDEARKEFSTPLACPKCKKSMRHHLDEKMWSIHKTCFNCVIDMEHELMKSGQYQDYEKNKILANAESFMKDLESYFKEAAQDSVSKSHVTEDGIVEKWKDVNQSTIEEIGVKVVNDINNKIKDYKES